MPSINQYSTLSDPSGSDLLPVYSSGNSDTRKLSLSALAAYVLAQQTAASGKQEFTTQYAAPSSTGFTVNITDGSDNIWLILTPTGTLATGTITLPALAKVSDKQEVLVNTTQEVTSFTVDGNGAVAVTGEPTTLSANDFFRLKYDGTVQTWYRVG
ncbi:MAG: hypothetical protein PVI43_01060 [Candidatus Bathyarchaeota archaeon]|jgi:hypothetical protein